MKFEIDNGVQPHQRILINRSHFEMLQLHFRRPTMAISGHYQKDLYNVIFTSNWPCILLDLGLVALWPDAYLK